MRKAFWFMLVALMVISAASVTTAQETIALTLGEPVEGEITEDAFEIEYTFNGNAGDIVLIQMWQAPDAEEYLDPYLFLLGTNGRAFAENDTDPAYYSQSTIVAELPDSGEYTILATRYDGRTGESVGPYVLQANLVPPLEPGAKIETNIYGYESDERLVPNQYVIRGGGSTKFGFSQETGDLFADISLYPWEDKNSYPTPAFEMTNTKNVSSGVLTVELDAGVLYVLTVKDSYASSVYDDSSVPVIITVG